MTSSMCSTMSGMTVSAFGQEEMDLEEAVNKLFVDLQTFVNGCHSGIRQLAMCDERADTYIEAMTIWKELDDDVVGALVLFKELRSISKQVLGKPPKQYKTEVDELKAKWKREEDHKKQQLKNEKAEQKNDV